MSKFYDIIEISYKGNIVATLLLLLAEQQLRGCKAWVERVMGECLKTPWAVLSRDLSCNRWTLPGRLWVSSNKSHDRHILLSNLKFVIVNGNGIYVLTFSLFTFDRPIYTLL